MVEGWLMSLKPYSVVSVRRLDPTICFGSVGIGIASFCVKKHCRTKAHVDAKLIDVWEVPGDTRIFIMRSENGTVFIEPSIAFDQSQQLTLAEWNREFCAVEIADDAYASHDRRNQRGSIVLSHHGQGFSDPV